MTTAMGRHSRPQRGRPRTWDCSPQIALGRLGKERELVPVTLPKLSLLDAQQPAIDDTAIRFMEHRTIKRGLEAWTAIGRAETFEAWKSIGAALAVGKPMLLRSPEPMRLGAETTAAHSRNG